MIGIVLFAAGATAQEPERPRRAIVDSLVAAKAAADTVVSEPAAADTAAAGGPLVGPLPGELQGTLRDSAMARPVAAVAKQLVTPDEGYSSLVYEWDREEILRSNALTLLDLLTEVVPGLTPLRATWFGGPHQVLDGVLGPGFISVRVDGRELTPVDAGQVDFTRIALAYVDRVRVVRRAGGWTADITTLRRSEPRAYSRITGGTGEPGLSRLRILFTNGLGRHFNVATSVDLLDTSGDRPSDDFDFWANVEWIPGADDGAGVVLHFETESLDRTVYEPEQIDRRELFLRARGNLAEGVQVEGFAGATELKQNQETLRNVANVGFRLVGRGKRGWARAGVGAWDDPLYPQTEIDGGAGFRILPGLAVDVGGRYTLWDRFTTSEVRAGLAVGGLPLGITLGGQLATGSRGVPYPALGTADSVSFDAGLATGAVEIGPFRISETVEYQNVSRQLPFGAVFDRDHPAGGPIELVAFETGLSGPVLPIGWVIPGAEPIRAAGFYRYTSLLAGDDQTYLPQAILRGEVYLQDDFFDGNLEVHAGVSLNYRDPIFTPPPPEASEVSPGDLVFIPSYTFLDWNLMVRILEVRVYWRYENMAAELAQDLPSLEFPPRRSVFGVKWEFLN